MSLLLNSIILNNFIEEEFEDDTLLITEYCSVEQIRRDKYISFLDAFNKKKSNVSMILKNNKNLFKSVMFQNNFIISDTTVLYVISITFLYKNVTIQVMDTKGLLKVSCSTTSSLKIIIKQQRVKIALISKLLKYFLDEVLYFNDEISRVPVALNLKSVNRKYLNLIVKKLKPKFNIKIINYFSCSPHNGCRPRKMRRV